VDGEAFFLFPFARCGISSPRQAVPVGELALQRGEGARGFALLPGETWLEPLLAWGGRAKEGTMGGELEEFFWSVFVQSSDLGASKPGGGGRSAAPLPGLGSLGCREGEQSGGLGAPSPSLLSLQCPRGVVEMTRSWRLLSPFSSVQYSHF